MKHRIVYACKSLSIGFPTAQVSAVDRRVCAHCRPFVLVPKAEYKRLLAKSKPAKRRKKP